ncbi:MAG: TlpA family protein disulfide reductase [Gammaproteobacteria bacterium]
MRYFFAVLLLFALTGGVPAADLGLQPAVGEVPAFVLEPLGEGETLRSESLAGRVVLLHFWATWCAPCRQELPALDRLAASLDPARFTVLMVSIDEEVGPAEVEAFARGAGVRGPLYRPGGKDVIDQFCGWGLPVSYLIDSQGGFIGRVMGARDWGDANVRAAVAQLGTR